MSTFVLIVLLIFVAIPIGQAIASLIASKAERRELPEEWKEHIGVLEVQIRALTEDVQALRENQEFLTRLLEGRSSGNTPAQIEDKRR
jgi:hypothetical protein